MYMRERVGYSYTGGFGEGAPAALAVIPDVVDEARVLVLGPRTFVCVSFLTAR